MVPIKRPTADPAPRRPGIEKLIAEIQRRNPSWSMNRIHCEAKSEWTERRALRAGQQGGAA